MDTPEQTRSPAHRRIRIATISLNLLAAVTALVVSVIGIARALGMPDIALANDETEIFGLLSVIAISGFIGLICAVPVILAMNILNWILSARYRKAARRVEPATGRARAEASGLPHT